MITKPARRLSLILLSIVSLLAMPWPIAVAQDTTALAQDAAAADTPPTTPPTTSADPRFSTPGNTLETFDKAFEAYRSDKRRLDMLAEAKLSCDFSQLDLDQAQLDTVSDLFRIMNRIEIIMAGDSQARDDADTYVFFPRPDDEYHDYLNTEEPGFSIELTKDADGEWKISKETVASAGEMYKAFKPFPNVTGQSDEAGSLGQQIRDAMPPTLRQSFLTVEYWMWIAIFIVIFIGVIIDHLVRGILSSVWHRIDKKRDGPTAEKDILKKAVRPFGLVAAAAFWLAMINVGGITGTPLMVLLLAIRLILSVGGVWAAWRMTDLVTDFLMRKAEGTENKYDDLLIPLFARTVKIFIIAMGIIYIAKALHIDVLPLLTGLGIGGLAVAFAAKDTIENFFGSVAVIIDQPFEVGDWINVEGVEGTVEVLGFRSTRVRTFYNSLVTVPNAMLVRATVDNYGKRQYRRWSTMLNLTYDTPPDTIEAFCEGVRELVRLHPYMRKDGFHVYLNSFGAHSLDVMLYVFFDCTDWAIELREKQRLMLDIIRLADRMGVGFAFPTQTLELKQLDPNLIHTPGAIPGETAQADSLSEGMKIARELTANQPWKTTSPGPVRYQINRGKAGSGEDEHEIRGSGGE
ncbi:MAG: MscS family membrane protein [Phycisphaerales bacterium]|jgi:MscS family membrane protein